MNKLRFSKVKQLYLQGGAGAEIVIAALWAPVKLLSYTGHVYPIYLKCKLWLWKSNVIYSQKLFLFSSQLPRGTKSETWQSLQQCGLEVRTGFQTQMMWKHCCPTWPTLSTIRTFPNGHTWISSGVWMPLTVCTMKSYIWWSRRKPAFSREHVGSGGKASDTDKF